MAGQDRPLEAQKLMDGFWDCVARHGAEANPYRAGFLQFVAVAESDAEAERLYTEPARYFYQRCLHVHPGFVNPPGYNSLPTIRAGFKSQVARVVRRAGARAELGNLSWKDFIERGYVVAGSPDTVVDRLNDLADKLRIGHLMVLLQFGNMPRDTAMYNLGRFAAEVMPRLRPRFSEFEDRWWPRGTLDELATARRAVSDA